MLAERLAEAGTHPAGDTTLADFVSVELAVSAGEATCVAVFDKFPVSVCRSTGRIVDLVRAAHQVLGVSARMTHTEVKLTPSAPEIIEINGRLGGDLARLTRLADGPNLVRAALQAALNLPIDRHEEALRRLERRTRRNTG